MAKQTFQEHGGGYETRLEQIKFIDSDFRVMWHWAHQGVMVSPGIPHRSTAFRLLLTRPGLPREQLHCKDELPEPQRGLSESFIC